MRKIKNIDQLIAKYNSYKITKEELREFLKGEPFGKVTGIIGPFVLRYHKGKLIISSRAVIYNASQSQESVRNRSNFAAEIKFARTLNRIDILKELWSKADAEGTSAHHKILKQNRIRNGSPSLTNRITPGKFHFHTEVLCMLDENLQLRINENIQLQNNDTLVAVIVPYRTADSSFEVINVTTSLADSSFSLSDEQISVIRRYDRYILYSALVRQNGDDLEWSNTVSAEGRVFSEETVKLVKAAVILLAGIYYRKKIYYNPLAPFTGAYNPFAPLLELTTPLPPFLRGIRFICA